MPRYAIFSDIHGNAEALDALVAHSEKEGVNAYLCCGDIVGYGADPAWCLETVQRLCPASLPGGPAIILGNHDEAVAAEEVSSFNPYAARAALWSREQLNDKQLELLIGLPLKYELAGEILLVHSAPYRPSTWPYVFDLADIQLAFDHFTQRICCVGHTHVPVFVEALSDWDPVILNTDWVHLDPGARYLVNVGSVGQPRDGDPRGCYVIYDTEENILQRFRFEYDIGRAQEKIRQAGLPPILAARLKIGF